MKTFSMLLTILLLSACASTGPSRVMTFRDVLALAQEQSTPYAPPAQYAQWWLEVELLTKQQKKTNYTDVLWYATYDEFDCKTHYIGETAKCMGMWTQVAKDHHAIFIATHLRNDERVVKHEMLHAQLQMQDHRHPLFGNTCCAQSLIAEMARR